MYSVVLAMVLAPGTAAPAADIETELRDLKRSIAQLRAEQNDTRIEELKLVIAGLRQKITDEKLDELRRDVLTMRGEEFVRGRRMMYYMPMATEANRATVSVEIPGAATFVVNDQQVAVPALDPTLRSRLNSPAASVRCAAGRVAKATVERGTQVKPRPMPWTRPLRMTSSLER